MEVIRDFLFQPEGWLILAVVLFGLEFFAPGVFFMWLGFAAVLMAGVALIPDFSWGYQLMVFAVMGVIFVYAGRNYVKKKPIRSEDENLNQRAVQNVGKLCDVVKPIRNGVGKVQLGDTVWRALGPDAKEGATVRVIGTEGTALKVEPAKKK